MSLGDFMEGRARRSDAVRDVVARAGAVYNGVQRAFRGEEDYATVTDPVTRSTFLVPLSEVTESRIRAEMAAMRKKFGMEG